MEEKEIREKTRTLGKPFWQYLQEAEGERKVLAKERIAQLQRYREMIDLEIETLGHIATPTIKTETTESWQYSLAGFHNPRRHQGMTPTQFINAYLKKGKYRKIVKEKKREALQFASHRFTQTLR